MSVIATGKYTEERLELGQAISELTESGISLIQIGEMTNHAAVTVVGWRYAKNGASQDDRERVYMLAKICREALSHNLYTDLAAFFDTPSPDLAGLAPKEWVLRFGEQGKEALLKSVKNFHRTVSPAMKLRRQQAEALRRAYRAIDKLKATYELSFWEIGQVVGDTDGMYIARLGYRQSSAVTPKLLRQLEMTLEVATQLAPRHGRNLIIALTTRSPANGLGGLSIADIITRADNRAERQVKYAAKRLMNFPRMIAS